MSLLFCKGAATRKFTIFKPSQYYLANDFLCSFVKSYEDFNPNHFCSSQDCVKRLLKSFYFETLVFTPTLLSNNIFFIFVWYEFKSFRLLRNILSVWNLFSYVAGLLENLNLGATLKKCYEIYFVCLHKGLLSFRAWLDMPRNGLGPEPAPR